MRQFRDFGLTYNRSDESSLRIAFFYDAQHSLWHCNGNFARVTACYQYKSTKFSPSFTHSSSLIWFLFFLTTKIRACARVLQSFLCQKSNRWKFKESRLSHCLETCFSAINPALTGQPNWFKTNWDECVSLPRGSPGTYSISCLLFR